MIIRLYDRFDRNFTAAILAGVDYVDSDGTIYFEDGTTDKYDPEYGDWEELIPKRSVLAMKDEKNEELDTDNLEWLTELKAVKDILAQYNVDTNDDSLDFEIMDKIELK